MNLVEDARCIEAEGRRFVLDQLRAAERDAQIHAVLVDEPDRPTRLEAENER